MLATFRPMLAAAAVLATVASPSVSAPATPVHAQAARPMLDHAAIARVHFGNDAPWYVDRIPFFESADRRIDAVYYYRWSLFRAHQRDLGALGYITTEFADDVAWQRQPYASLNDATGFHIAEGRWLNDRRFTDDYVNFMYEGGNDRHFSDYMADSVWGRYLVDGDRAAVIRHLAVMRHIYGLWDDHFDFTKGLYFIEPLLDATEYTVSSIDASGGEDGFRGGDAFRPTINSYMTANARAIAKIAELAGDKVLARFFTDRADELRTRMLADLWNPALVHFTDRYKTTNEHVKYWEPIRARELAGYLPWMFDLVPDDPRYAQAWAHLLDPESLAGKAGMRTVEKSYPYYMRQYRYLGTARECQWNGPVWPYQTTQVLTAMANLLDHYGDTGPVTRSDYMRLLRQYTALHYQGSKLDLEEDYDPATGKPIVGLDRSHHYFHSGYIDLILSGLVGIRPRADDVLEVNPLLPAAGDPQTLAWFRAEDVPYHGHKIAVTWDADGTHYGRGPGLSVEIDGKEVARRADLDRLTIPVVRTPNPPIVRPINHAVQLVRGQFPMASASSNADPEMLHDAIDGRLWFFPELPNGWTSAPSNDSQWFEVNFGKPVDADTAELAFFDDGHSISAPVSVTIEGLSADRWHPLAQARPLANGITRLRWSKRAVSRLKVRMDPVRARSIRLVEFRASSSASPVRTGDSGA
ncbi:MGH1-like glycoside hydrolase domain-containing protein [Novosphingobium album (ex Hu et al. 2023)]|uniref:Glycogen debranching protein n=1 Tax=Novosphingobium album (ex Hu et al. 2023) TaxID=2930093 RepID=A0ABT0B428_9SPHN|nr:glycosyl hydrolase family 65 protein [Novosphingobium album (ex Hu et al. 2023)]MCJ2179655.1 glycogen debranching protein [Novosphingobium album (ex Hu et al. 2023)]